MQVCPANCGRMAVLFRGCWAVAEAHSECPFGSRLRTSRIALSRGIASCPCGGSKQGQRPSCPLVMLSTVSGSGARGHHPWGQRCPRTKTAPSEVRRSGGGAHISHLTWPLELQKGQSKVVGTFICGFLVGAFLADFRLPISEITDDCEYMQ